MEEKELSLQEAVALRSHCQRFSRLGWALFAQMLSGSAVQLVILVPIMLFFPALLENNIFIWALAVFCTYCVGLPVFYLIARTVPAPEPGPAKPLGPARLGQVYLISLSALYLSNFVTLGLLSLIETVAGAPVSNPVDSMLDFPLPLILLLSCVFAPIAEELVFRKLLLDRLRPYGERFAMLASALAFGLFHGNLSQLFYAFCIGLILAYVALKTNRIWQSILLHALINFISAGLVPLFELFGEAGEGAFTALILLSILLGIVFFVALRRDIHLECGSIDLTERKKWRLFFENPGVACFCLLVALSCAAMLFV